MSQPGKLAGIFLTIATAVIAGFVTVSLIDQATVRSNRELMQCHTVISHLQAFLSSLKDAETGQRGYLLTGDEAYLEPHKRGVKQTRGELAALASMAKAGDLSAQDVRRLSQLTGQKLDELQHTIELRRTKGLEPALAVVQTDFGKDVMDAIRAQTGQMIAAEESAMARAHQSVDEFVGYSRLAVGLGALIGLAVLAWAYRRIEAESSGRLEAAFDLQRQKELLEVTLSSIGDAVIISDIEARVIFMNAVAEQLTGWTSAQAMYKPCAEVFRIISESSREMVESPVHKVLSMGMIVGLANHTLLIRKDGSEIPIDDSGAPIKEQNGSVHGVVLVFRDFSEH
ncbi:MAG TPA: CHASE3 domain-containing protein, partial [Candidatus Binataceae bacterium]|nr:CHASE3 domain-containing protein [Candidatus Binataceae bacterium]